MPRSNSIPLPRIAGVSRAGPPVKMSGQALAAPGVAAANMIQTGLDVAGGLIQQRNAIQSERAKLRWDTAATVFDSEISTNEQLAFDAWSSQNASSGDPKEMMDQFDKMATYFDKERTEKREQLLTYRNGLSGEDLYKANLQIEKLDAKYEQTKHMAEQAAIILADKRLASIEKARLTQDFIFAFGDEGNEDKLAEIEKNLSKHYRSEEELNTFLDGLKSQAIVQQLGAMLDLAVTNEDFQQIEKVLKDREDKLTLAQSTAIKDGVNKGIFANQKEARILEFTMNRDTQRGIPINFAQAQDAEERGIVDKGFTDKMVKQLDSALDTKELERLQTDYNTVTRPIIRKELAGLIGGTKEDSKILVKNVMLANDIIEKSAEGNPVIVLDMKREFLQQIGEAIRQPDSSFFSEYLGQQLTQLPENVREQAFKDYNGYITKAQKILKDNPYINISKFATQLEVGLADLYEAAADEKKIVTKEAKDLLFEEVQFGIAGEVVKESLKSKIPFVDNAGWLERGVRSAPFERNLVRDIDKEIERWNKLLEETEDGSN